VSRVAGGSVATSDVYKKYMSEFIPTAYERDELRALPPSPALRARSGASFSKLAMLAKKS
jgi:hypothetical protein